MGGTGQAGCAEGRGRSYDTGRDHRTGYKPWAPGPAPLVPEPQGPWAPPPHRSILVVTSVALPPRCHGQSRHPARSAQPKPSAPQTRPGQWPTVLAPRGHTHEAGPDLGHRCVLAPAQGREARGVRPVPGAWMAPAGPSGRQGWVRAASHREAVCGRPLLAQGPHGRAVGIHLPTLGRGGPTRPQAKGVPEGQGTSPAVASAGRHEGARLLCPGTPRGSPRASRTVVGGLQAETGLETPSCACGLRSVPHPAPPPVPSWDSARWQVTVLSVVT